MTREPERRDRNPEERAEAWNRIIRDSAMTALAAFLFVFGGLEVRDPAILTIMFGAGAALLGLPPAWRISDQRKQRAVEKDLSDW